MTSPKRGKDWGYEVEVLTLRALRALWPGMRRTGASNQKQKGAADLMLEGRVERNTLLLVVTKDKGRGHPLMVSLPMGDFLTIAAAGVPSPGMPVYVSVKGRARTWLGTLYGELADWTRGQVSPRTQKKMTRGGQGV